MPFQDFLFYSFHSGFFVHIENANKTKWMEIPPSFNGQDLVEFSRWSSQKLRLSELNDIMKQNVKENCLNHQRNLSIY